MGDWHRGNFISGQWQFRNGDIYEGGFAKNRPEGAGKFMFAANKTTLYGTFADTKWLSGRWKHTPVAVLATGNAARKRPSMTFDPAMVRANQPSFVIPMRFC
jgi:hypothetical protein